MTRNHFAGRLSGVAIAGIAALTFAGLLAAPAAADTLPAPGCVTACTAVFNTAGSTDTLAIPAGITSLSATIAGAAGAPASFAITNDPTAVGGSGGVTTVDLGTTFGGETLTFGVGNTGQGSYVQDGSALIAVVGGGGGGGYAGLLDDATQISATYPGGNGGAPSGPGVAPGSDATPFNFEPAGLAADGGGGTTLGGVAGTGDHPGTVGGAITLVGGAGSTLAPGGAGGTFTDPTTSLSHVGGVGGTGYTGGGGGAIERNVPNGDVPADLVAPGGGGAGFLAASVTATDQPFNTGTGYVTFTWSFTPTISTTTTTTTAHRGDVVPVTITGLPANTAFTVTFDGSTVITDTSDSSGDATESFTVASGQVAGSFALDLVAGGTTVATSDPVQVIVVLAATGSPSSVLPGSLAALLILTGASVFLFARRGKTRARSGPASQ